jgi:hypothetical protein
MKSKDDFTRLHTAGHVAVVWTGILAVHTEDI